jgi:hypothetical protein
MKVAILLVSLLASASSAKVELRPLKRVTVLPMGSCEATVTFRLSVSDGGSEDYYCPAIVWEWEDGTRSTERSDCAPFEQAAAEDRSRAWTRSRTYQRAGSFRIRAHLCQAHRRVRTIDTLAVIRGWEGYDEDKREAYGCSPARVAAQESSDLDQAQKARPWSLRDSCS